MWLFFSRFAPFVQLRALSRTQYSLKTLSTNVSSRSKHAPGVNHCASTSRKKIRASFESSCSNTTPALVAFFRGVLPPLFLANVSVLAFVRCFIRTCPFGKLYRVGSPIFASKSRHDQRPVNDGEDELLVIYFRLHVSRYFSDSLFLYLQIPDFDSIATHCLKLSKNCVSTVFTVYLTEQHFYHASN